MTETIGRATRTTAFIAVIVGFLMLGLPSMNLGGQDAPLSLVDDVAASPGSRTLRVSYVSLMDTLQTLNPFLYTWGTEGMVMWNCYSTLLTYGVNSELRGDLAVSWDSSPDGLTWHIKIVNNARFYNRLEANGGNHPLTAADVIYTFTTFQNVGPNSLQFYFPLIPGQPGRLIENMWSDGNYDIYIKLRAVYAPFLSALTLIPILPQYIWSQYNPLTFANYDSRNNIPPIVGSGPYIYNLNSIPSSGAVELVESPSWFARDYYGYDVKPNLILLRDETEPTAQSHFNDYSSDAWLSPTGDQYAAIVDTATVDKFHSAQGYVWEFNMNQLTLENRILYDVGGAQDWNNQLLLDPTVKLALQMSIDKSEIATNVLAGLASPSDSLVPAVSIWHYTYGTDGETPITFNPAGARALLNAAGWAYTTTGAPATSTTTPLCKQGGSDPLSFRFFTPNTNTKYHDASLLIQQWADLAGVQLVYDGPDTGAFMNSAWAAADYDTWLWNWWFTPTSDPSADVLQVLTAEAIGSWSDVYWVNETYDAMYYESLQVMDFDQRRLILNEMQKLAYTDSGCWPVVSVDNLYAMQTVPALNGDQWVNYGDWTTTYFLCPDSYYYWLWLQMYPLDNPSPGITGFTEYYEGDVDHPTRFTGSVVGESSVEFRWNFGDGTFSPWTTWTSGAYVDHQYAEDGFYDAYFMVRETSGSDVFMSSKQASVKIIDDSNTPPRNLQITTAPVGPDAGTIVWINGTAIDDQSDPMTFSWDFGDGTTGYGQQTTHQFSAGAGTYTITMYVDDGHLSQAPRPSSTTALLGVGANQPPSISVQDEPSVEKTTLWPFQITASDPNPRDTLRYTWNWGDGDPVSVSSGATQTVYHSYKFTGDFVLTVYADDLTGLPGHNVSDTGLVHVVRTGNHVPSITSFTASKNNPLTGEVVTFTGTGTDLDGDLLIYTWTFGDGATATSVQSAPNTTLTVTHRYLTPGVYQAYLSVFDGAVSKLSSAVPIVATEATFGLSLLAGWNLVAVPLVNTGYMASNLGLVYGEMVVGWNPLTQTYDRNYYAGTPIGNFALEETEGYWIYAASAKTITLRGDLAAGPQIRNIDVPIGGGWAIVGLVKGTSTQASAIPPMYSIEGSISMVSDYLEASGTYRSYYTGVPPTDFAIPAGQAVWIWCGASGTLTYNV